MATPYPQWLAREERKADRRLLTVGGTAGGTRTAPQPVEIVDVSPLGCRLRVTIPVPVGSYITLASAAAASLEGWVAWSRDRECGIDFAQPVPDPLIDRIVAHAPG